jgi:hypothetical protein
MTGHHYYFNPSRFFNSTLTSISSHVIGSISFSIPLTFPDSKLEKISESQNFSLTFEIFNRNWKTYVTSSVSCVKIIVVSFMIQHIVFWQQCGSRGWNLSQNTDICEIFVNIYFYIIWLVFVDIEIYNIYILLTTVDKHNLSKKFLL